jgi:hypothetical protein
MGILPPFRRRVREKLRKSKIDLTASSLLEAPRSAALSPRAAS